VQAFVVVSAPAAAELYNCAAPYQSYFDGAYTSTNTVIGSSAKIVNRFGAVCDTDTTNDNVSTAWTMIAGNGFLQYAQAGFIRWYGSPDYFFAQDNDGGAPRTTFGVALANYGETHQYWDQWSAGCNCVQEVVDVTIFQSTPYNPRTAWTQPFSNQWLGEVKYTASDMPGNSTEGWTTYTLMQVQLAANSLWTNTLPVIGYVNNNPARWSHDTVVGHPAPVGNAYDLWTLP